jgi:hypothetical protein
VSSYRITDAAGDGPPRRSGPESGRGLAGPTTPPARLAVTVHHRAQAEAALALERPGLEIVLVSAPGAARYAGVGFLRALGDLVGREMVVDCGDDAGLVLAGLRTGLRRLVFTGRPDVLVKLKDIAGQLGGEVAAARPEPCLELAPEDDPARALSPGSTRR